MVLIGMTEISSCVFLDKIKVGTNVMKGEQLGHFQFGGSSGIIILPKSLSSDSMWNGITANDPFKVGKKLIKLIKLP